MTKGAGKTATGQKSPGGAPAGVAGVTVGSSAQRTVILETVGTVVVRDQGLILWLCLPLNSVLTITILCLHGKR